MITRNLTRAAVVAIGVTMALAVTAEHAHAQRGDRITIGLYAPSVPFGGPSQRLDFINKLAQHLSSASGGKQVVGRVFSSARQLSSAAKKGDIQFAVVDAPYAAARGLPYKILAAGERSGKSTASWQLVASGGVSTLADLKDKKVAVAQTGARVPNFVTDVLLQREVRPKFFQKIDTAPNSSAAAAMVNLGRVDAAFVPSGTSLPGGVAKVLSLRSIGLPMFAAMKGTDKALVEAFGKSVTSFRSGGFISGFGAASGGRYRALRGSFGRSKHKGMFAVPKPARLAVSGILEGRNFQMKPTDISALITAPAPKTAAK